MNQKIQKIEVIIEDLKSLELPKNEKAELDIAIQSLYRILSMQDCK